MPVTWETEAGGSKVQSWGLGAGDDSVARMLAAKAIGLEFESPAPM